MGPNYYVTPEPQTSGPSRKTLFIIIGLTLAVIFGVILLLAGNGKSISTQLQALSLRMENLQGILDDSTTTRNIKNQELSQITTNLSLSLASDINTLNPIMINAGLPTEYNQNIINAETDLTSKEKLEEAALNNRLDQVYAEVLQDKIASIRPLIAETYSMTNSGELKNALSETDTHLAEYEKRLAGLRFD